MSDSTQDSPDPIESPSWWLAPNFSAACAKFNEGAKVMGDHGLPPAIRSLLLENEECQHREVSGLRPKKALK
jgi:hypothetical protein